MKKIIEKLLDKQDLTQSESKNIMLQIMSGDFSDVQISGFLIALRSKGDRSSEIAGFAEAMRLKMRKVNINFSAIDMCGTGGDSKGTFNISTAASFIVSASGVKVAKHGNRSMTSRSGSADVLESLGINITLSPDKVAKQIKEIGIGFMFAPNLHPAMKHAMCARQELGIRTVFNLLGPLCNPANVKRQAMGIFDGNLTEKIARVLKKLGTEEAYIFHGEDGLDEITISNHTILTHLDINGKIKTIKIHPTDYGFIKCDINELKGGEPNQNAKIILDILNGKKGFIRDIVVLNAAAGIKIGNKANSIEEGINIAQDIIDSGAALDKLERMKKYNEYT